MGRTLIFDIESNGLFVLTIDSKKKTASLPGTKIFCLCAVDVNTGEQFKYGPTQIEEGVDLLRSADVLIGHNVLMFDIPMLEKFYGPIDVKTIDTLIISRLLFGKPQEHDFPLKNNQGKPAHSLEAWGNWLKKPKMEFEWTPDVEFSDEMLAYCMNDVMVNLAIYRTECTLLKGRNLKRAMQIEHKTYRLCSFMTRDGFSFDLPAARQYQYELQTKQATINDRLQAVFPPIVTERWHKRTGKPLKPDIEIFNPGASQHIARRLKEKYGWKCPLTEKGNPEISDDLLLSLPYPEAHLIGELGTIDKKLGYLFDWITRAEYSPDSRIHASFDPQQAGTSRMSSSQPNVQQIDKDPRMRSLFKPPTGFVQVGADASGIEGRLAAHECFKFDNGAFVAKILHGDIHDETRVAMGFEPKPGPLPDGSKAVDVGRDRSKTFLYGGILYGAGGGRIGEICNCDAKRGLELKAKYLEAVPSIAQIIDNAQFELQSRGYVTLFDGRQVAPTYEWDDRRNKWSKPKHKALNYKLQGNGACVMKVAHGLLWDRLMAKYPPSDWFFMAAVHDEFQLAVKPYMAKDVGEMAVQAIRDAGEELGCKCPLDGQYKIGKNWSETH